MSSPDVDSSFHKLCECAICLEILTNPCLLQCEHSFCKECLDKIVKFESDCLLIICPTCQVQHVLRNGMQELKASLPIKQMLDIINKNR